MRKQTEEQERIRRILFDPNNFFKGAKDASFSSKEKEITRREYERFIEDIRLDRARTQYLLANQVVGAEVFYPQNSF